MPHLVAREFAHQPENVQGQTGHRPLDPAFSHGVLPNDDRVGHGIERGAILGWSIVAVLR